MSAGGLRGNGAAPPDRTGTFDFRMSKKVAELTQVVHMLFMRNHEKEVQLEALKDAYEYEIELVLRDARERITSRDGRIADLQDGIKTLEEKRRQEATAKDHLISSKEREWRDMEKLKGVLVEKDEHIQRLQKALAELEAKSMNKNQVFEDFNTRHDALAKQQRETEKRNKEIDSLKLELDTMEQKLVEQKKRSQASIEELSGINERLREKLGDTETALEETVSSRRQLEARRKQLEDELKNLKYQLSSQTTLLSKKRNTEITKSTPEMRNRDEELDKLKQEILWYKMELKNREVNFNRIFSEKQPVLVGCLQREVSRLEPGTSTSSGVPAGIQRQRTTLLPPAMSRIRRSGTQVAGMMTLREGAPGVGEREAELARKIAFVQNFTPDRSVFAPFMRDVLPRVLGDPTRLDQAESSGKAALLNASSHNIGAARLVKTRSPRNI